MMWKEAVVTYFKLLMWNPILRTGEDEKISHLMYPVTQSKIESSTSGMGV
jgi:hypothetical protein